MDFPAEAEQTREADAGAAAERIAALRGDAQRHELIDSAAHASLAEALRAKAPALEQLVIEEPFAKGRRRAA